ncbi:acetyltransferase [Clostridium fungisolvens]|uniref:Acetyltransferase EpsM n=1 Tax=Clostridium fungisolvens TaxID=1604897 RepID=A0A6V8SKM2_9CLOT|nr:acetyltransferase [Clostridium fungisolvens]GFP77105.1 Putative acetyltransferase EpsM [Clostridium fungisolvens]
MEDLLLIGGGGHCKGVLDTITSSDNFNVVGIIDIKEKVGSYVDEIKVIGTDDDLEKIFENGIKNAFITIGNVNVSSVRRNIFMKLKKIGFKFPQIIDSSAVISTNCIIGEGTYVGKRVVVNSHAIIGVNCIINSGSIIEHDCIIGDFTHIAPGAVLSGGVNVGNNSLLGTNSTVIQGINIGENTLIGAGSVVIKNINDNCIAYGNPCKEIKR